MKLGRLPAPWSSVSRALRLSSYVPIAGLPRPARCEWAEGVSLPAFGNLETGDCTFAAFAALVASWTNASRGVPTTLGDGDVVGAYAAATGYRPGDPTTDLGAAEPYVVDYLTGAGVAGHRVSGHAYVSPSNRELLESAVYLFGGVSVDLSLPLAAMGQVEAGYWYEEGGPGREWTPGSWGLHEAAALGYSADGLVLRTWGYRVLASWGWVGRYATGAWAFRSEDFVLRDGRTAASGVDVASWDRDLAELASLGGLAPAG